MKQFALILLALFAFGSYAQPVYQMSNMVVYDCEGILTDSDAGNPTGNYTHNENYVFTIQAPIVAPINFAFTEFCTEDFFDELYIYDGPDIFSPLLAGPLSGTTIPPEVVANSGSITISFISDANVSCTGWVANWEVDIEDPITPFFTFDFNPENCSTDVVTLYFDQSLICDSVHENSFQILGPLNQTITNISSNNCSTGVDSIFTLNLSPGLDSNGIYTFNFTYVSVNECNEVFVLDTFNTLPVYDCPLWVNLVLDEDSICPNECTYVTVNVSGGDSSTYSYNWNNGLSNSPGPHLICPISDTLISVIVSDSSPSISSADSGIIYLFEDSQIILFDSVYCKNDEIDTLVAIPIGGIWSGSGIVDANLGVFDPAFAQIGVNQLFYTTINGCKDSVEIFINDIEAGADLSVCLGSPSFQISTGLPIGGYWQGVNIDSAGTYFNHINSDISGDFIVTYTINGCLDSLTVYIDSLQILAPDSLCVNEPPFQIPVSPFGGIFSGNGIIDTSLGIYDASLAGLGADTVIYSVIGCSDTIIIFNKEIYAGEDFYACPFEDTIQLLGLPLGGFWTGTGIVDPLQGLFDPSNNGGSNFTSDLVYTYLGCSDTVEAKVRLTKVDTDTLYFCEYEDYMVLNYSNTGRWPPDGNWTGTGVVPNDPWNPRFYPSVSGVGVFTIFYELNSCVDSIVMIVNPKPIITQDTSMCSESSLVDLFSNPQIGLWSGAGIIDFADGIFDPSQANVGINEIVFISNVGCSDTLNIDLYTPSQLSIIGLDSIYCFQDSAYPIVGIPIGSVLYGDGVGLNTFNPSLADEGNHFVYITYGVGDCQAWDSTFVTVLPPVQTELFVLEDTLCFGDSTLVYAVSSGGNGSAFQYNWNPFENGYDSVVVNPDQSTFFTVTATDNCSDSAIDSSLVFVYPEILYQINTNPIQCYGTVGFADIVMNIPGDYSYEWNSIPPQFSSMLQEEVDATYNVVITNNVTGCVVDTFAHLPSFEFINANFITNPNNDCALLTNPYFEFLDLSVGGNFGTWDFGDGSSDIYVEDINTNYLYQDTGTYSVTLIIENFGGCSDTIIKNVCVENDYVLHIPNAFTPNNDNLNDTYKIIGIGIRKFNMKIFNRWGEIVFESNDINVGWDGNYKGKKSAQGSYTYLLNTMVLDDEGEITKTFTGMLYLLR